MHIAESSTSNEQLQWQQEPATGRDTSAATPAPTPMSASEGRFHTDDEEKAENGDVPRTPSGSAQPQGSKRRKRKKRRKNINEEGIRSRSPVSNPTIISRLNPALILENSGSVARDHLASERTFLAYVRTSLALASTGVALVQLFTIADLTSQSYHLPDTTKYLQRFSRPLGSTTIILGIIVLFIGLIRYFAVQNALVRGVYPTARTSIVFVTIVLLTITVIVFAVLLAGKDR